MKILRHDEILSLLVSDRVVPVSQLAKRLYVSEATIRRDLAEMDKLGLIRRTHGGALLARDTSKEASFASREADHLIQKKTISTLAASHIEDNTVLFMDSGSTLLPLAKMLDRFSHLSVVTHGLRTALVLSGLKNIKVFVAGGMIENFSNSILGSPVSEFYTRMNADVAIMTCSGIDANGNITDDDLDQAKIKQMMISRSKSVYLLCDSSKFNKTRMNTGFTIDQVDMLFSDRLPDEPLLSRIKESGCVVVTPDTPSQKGLLR